MPKLPKGYHFKTINGKAVPTRNPGSYGKPKLRLEDNKLVEVRPVRKTPPKEVHKNSNDYVGETHLYAIKDREGKILKYGESSQGFNKKGQSKRAHEQVRKLERENPGKEFEAKIVRKYDSKADARHGPRGERKYIETHRKVFGKESLPLNKGNR